MKKQPATMIFAACFCLLAASLWAQQGATQSRAPEKVQAPERVQVPNDQYDTPEKRAGIAKRLDQPEREQRLKPEWIIATLGIKPGDRVADIGTGTGILLPYLSRAVSPGGLVYAEDIFPDFLDRARAKAEKLKLDNVRFVLGDEKNPRLPQGEIDVAMILDAYHHFEFPKAMLDNIRASLKPEGRIAIVDFFKRGDMSNHVRLDRDAVAKEVERFGWKLEASPEGLENQYILIFKRPPQ